jgi:hypothetical protein
MSHLTQHHSRQAPSQALQRTRQTAAAPLSFLRWADQMNTPSMDTCRVRVRPLTALDRYERSARYDEIDTTALLEPVVAGTSLASTEATPFGWFQTDP